MLILGSPKTSPVDVGFGSALPGERLDFLYE